MAELDLVQLRPGATDRLIFEADGVPTRAWLWDGPWPPPPTLAIVTHKADDRVKIVNPEGQLPGHMEWAQASEEVAVEWFRCAEFSHIADPAPVGEHWFRKGSYVPVVGAERI